MAYWLVKTEPSCWSWSDHVAKGEEPWDRVRNHQAAKYLRAMQPGDRVFFYHSQSEKAVVGVLEVTGPAVPDPGDPEGRFPMVPMKPVGPFAKPVTLAAIKADPRLEDLLLVRQSRLSVMPIPDQAWAIICDMGGLAAA